MSRIGKYTSILLAIVVGFSLAACDSGDTKVIINNPSTGSGSGSGGGSSSGGGTSSGGNASNVVTIMAGPQMGNQMQKAIDNAEPGTVIQLPKTDYKMAREVTIDNPGVTLRGKGSEKGSGTILDFSNQRSGGESMDIGADNVTVKDLAIVNTPGGDDATKVSGKKNEDGSIDYLNNITFDNVRVSWDAAPSKNDGAYGFYPVMANNVLIQNSKCIGSNDSCVYVGQSKNIIVRNNLAAKNVTGIEIENSKNADVYGNTATNNTNGMIIFTQDGLPVQFNSRTRVYNNKIYNNNVRNFGGGGLAANIPTGTGILILGRSRDEIYNNEIYNNETINVGLISFKIVNQNLPDSYNPYPEAIYLHDNTIYGGGDKPGNLHENPASPGDTRFGELFNQTFNGQVPNIVWDGSVNPDHKAADGLYKPGYKLCIQNNKQKDGSPISFDTLAKNGDLSNHDCDGSNLNLRQSPVSLPQLNGQNGG